MGAGPGRGRGWPWSWGSAYLKALSSLCLSFFLPLLPTSMARRSRSFLYSLGGGCAPSSPHPGRKGQCPLACFCSSFSFGQFDH